MSGFSLSIALAKQCGVRLYLENTLCNQHTLLACLRSCITYALRMQKAVRSAAPREGGRISALLIAESRGKNEGAKSFRMRGRKNA